MVYVVVVKSAGVDWDVSDSTAPTMVFPLMPSDSSLEVSLNGALMADRMGSLSTFSGHESA
jgi:hypothetical protein